MPTATHPQSEKVFREMVDLLEELMSVYADTDADKESEEEERGVGVDDLIDVMVEEAEDRGLNGEMTERFLKLAVSTARKSAEV